MTRNNVSPSPDACDVELTMRCPGSVPPYGKEVAPHMKTIYDFKHLNASAHFLRTQYRMPVLLGEFISEYVYDKKLLSVHPVTDFSAVRFVDVWSGQEERVGTSWKVNPFTGRSCRVWSAQPCFRRTQRRHAQL